MTRPAGSGDQDLVPLAGSYRVVHDIPGRMRLRPRRGAGLEREALERALTAHPALAGALITISRHTGSVLVLYQDAGARRAVLEFFRVPAIRQEPGIRAARALSPAPETSGEPLCEQGPPAVRNPVPEKLLTMLFPRVAQAGLAVVRALPYLLTAVKSLLRGKLSLDVLDGAALLVCLLRRDFRAVSTITFFFALGEYLADWTRKKSRASLVESLALNIDQVWVKLDGVERQMPLAEVEPGDLVVVRAGGVLPVDGTVSEGEGLVNQSSMTGEPLPVHKKPGLTVYAGTVLAEGELVIAATKVGSDTRIRSIVRTIEESEAAKASIQGKYERVADAIVPYNFLLSGLVFAATRNPTRAGSVLLVDYSCAIRLTTPLTIFTAMREAADLGVLIKGGKFMEAAAAADVVVFDKTGTLTEASPRLVDVAAFAGWTEECVLRLAACLEEHFAHPVGHAVVRAAEEQNLKHREEHAQVEFIVAHGIASLWRDRRVLIGSEHFVHEDEGIPILPEQRALISEQAALGRSVLYLAVGGELAGLLFIEDSIRPEAADIVDALRKDGVARIIMLTGDGELTARTVAERAGIDEFRSQLLPEDKARLITELKQQGHTVMMVGDGINDSPAMAAAHVGVAMAEGADMAREVADMVLVNGQLADILRVRKLSRRALARVRKNFYASVICNSIFLAGGLLGLIMPGVSALLHNATTGVLAVRSVRPLLPQEATALPAGTADEQTVAG